MPKMFYDKTLQNNKEIIDTIYANSLVAEELFVNTLFDGDFSRVVYANNEESFYQRRKNLTGQGQNVTGFNLPFFNYALTVVTEGDESRNNKKLYLEGVYEPTLKQKIKARPMRLEYEATFWCANINDAHIAKSRLAWIAEEITTLQPIIHLKNGVAEDDLALFAHVDMDVNFDPTFDFGDYKEKGELHSVTFDFTIETSQISSNTEVSIPERFLLTIARNYGLETDNTEVIEEFIIDHFNETVEDA